MPSKLQKAIGAVKDQTSISLAKVSSNTYSNLEVAILKATTHDDDVPIDHKSITEVLRLVSSNKSHAAACARAIGKRIGRTRNWIVALKSLMLVLRIFQDGDPYFPREVLHAMKRGAKILNLSGFRDDSSSSPWDFTSFIRTFALYIDERLECFVTGKLQRRYTHVTGGSWIHQRANSRMRRPVEPIRDMKPTMLLEKISCWQRLIERAIATRPTGPAKMNRLVHVALYAVVQESFDLYKDVSDGLTLVLDSFFHLQLQNCMSAFEACAKAAKQFRELSDFYSFCKSIGVGTSSEYPSVQTISVELIDALQEFLKDQNSSFPSKHSHRFGPLIGGRSDKSNWTTDTLPQRSTSKMGLQCTTSLEDLIKASETGTCPAISIDLEAYSGPRQDDAFTISDTGSTRSLPVSNSMADLISLFDWSELEEREQQQQQQQMQQQQGYNQMGLISDSSTDHPKNWELVLAETISLSADTTTSQTSDVAENHQSTAGWEVILFEATQPAPHRYMQQPTLPNNVVMMPTTNHYNPFLQETLEMSNFQCAPTFQAVPSFAMQSSNQMPFVEHVNNDPFKVSSFSSELVFSGSGDQQNLLFEQQLWLRNQNKIIAKHMT
ncbi:hypothetical protein OROGR_012179 [Orobanche gracilis]